MKILVVEDNGGARRSFCRLLADNGHVVCSASDCSEGIEMAKTNLFDLIITDFDTPGEKNGHDLIREVLAAKPESKIWFMTGYPDQETFQDALSLGAKTGHR